MPILEEGSRFNTFIEMRRKNGEILRGVVQTHATSVFAKGHIAYPMQAVFNAPMRAYGVGLCLASAAKVLMK